MNVLAGRYGMQQATDITPAVRMQQPGEPEIPPDNPRKVAFMWPPSSSNIRDR